jgi:hypothetical protein
MDRSASRGNIWAIIGDATATRQAFESVSRKAVVSGGSRAALQELKRVPNFH